MNSAPLSDNAISDSGNRHIKWHLSEFRTVACGSVCLRLDANYGYPEESGIGNAHFYPLNPDFSSPSPSIYQHLSEFLLGKSYNLLQTSCSELTIRCVTSGNFVPQVTICNQIVTSRTSGTSSLHSVRRNAFQTSSFPLLLFYPTRPICPFQTVRAFRLLPHSSYRLLQAQNL